MSAITNYLANKLRDHTLANTAYTSPTTVYLALFTTPTTSAGGGTEVTGGTYARQVITFDDYGNDGYAEQDIDTVFTDMPTCTVTHVAIMDHISNATNMLLHGALPTQQSVTAADNLTLPSATVRFLFD